MNRACHGVLAATLMALSLPINSAKAVPISAGSQLSITGFNDLDFGAGTITFLFANPFSTFGETGSFLTLGNGGSIALDHQGSAISFNTLTAGSDLGCGAGCIFVGSANGSTVSFNLMSETVSTGGGFLLISGAGVMKLSGFDDTPGTFAFSSQAGSGSNLSFSSTVGVPGPIGGAGLPGLVLACGGLIALARRRRQRMI